MTDLEQRLTELLAGDAARLSAFRAVRARTLLDGGIGAGFIRNAVWDALHGRPPRAALRDVDVIWFGASRATAAIDEGLEAALRQAMPALPWSVRNQARMHTRNADAPYRSATDAMRHWPETASAVAAWLDAAGRLHIAAPCGLDHLVLRFTPVAAARRPQVFAARLAAKPWLHEWPRLRVAGPAA